MEETQIKFAVKKSDYVVEIAPALEKKIRYLCNKFTQREWSGILFYEYTGAFASNDIKFIAKDLLFMDEGNATSTEFDLDNPDVVGYMCDNDLFGCQTGLIHSHQSFKAFFSGQDDSMLKQEGAKRNHFLSLVVNNDREYVARVTSKESYKYTIKGTCVFKTFNNEEATKEVEEEKEQVAVIAYDLNITYPEFDNEYQDLESRIEECKKQKEEKKKKEEATKQPYNFNTYGWSNKMYDDSPSQVQTSKDSQQSIKWVNDIPYLKEDKPNVPTKRDVEDTLLAEEECAKYAAQLITLDFCAEKKDIFPFLTNMEKTLDERFDTEEDYKNILHLVADEILDFELGCELLYYVGEGGDVDSCLVKAKMEIAEYIESITKYHKNKYINTITEYLYA